MPTRSLPSQPNLEQLKLQARELLRAHREKSRAAAARIRAHHPRRTASALEKIIDTPLKLADAQLVVAREYGFADWTRLKHRIELGAKLAKIKPHPKFEEAVAALDAGDLKKLKGMIEADPSLVKARGNLDLNNIGYFSGATLLHHVAGNPNRVPLPKNIVAIARYLLEAGADVHASTIGPNCGDTMSLVITSRYSSEYGVAGELIDLLIEHGAKLDVRDPDVIHMALTNHSSLSAQKMIELGATADVCASAALGRMDLLKKCFDRDGKLTVVTKRNGKELDDRDAIGLALLLAYVNRKPEAVDFLLEKDGNWNMIGVNNGAALHRAAIGGDLPMVQRLVAKGADIHNRDNPFNATPYSWANHDKKQEVMDWMRRHCAIDLHDAAAFGLPEHIEARLREDPKSINKRIDQWSLPQSTALHLASLTKRAGIVKTLLALGADKSIVAGDGRTALDIARSIGADDVVKLLQ